MFEIIRTHRRWMQLILLLLIVPSFMLVGVQGYDSFINREPELATVAGQPVTRSEFDQPTATSSSSCASGWARSSTRP
ncbi:SurA N-terminal domain protein [Bordetella bronchiseptica SBL-F6116]|nr:SurA N-terminal domain protein [Bordetella bronchiseptica SBL-F6116]